MWLGNVSCCCEMFNVVVVEIKGLTILGIYVVVVESKSFNVTISLTY